MSLIGVIWVVLLILKFVGVIATGWLWLIFWPLILAFVLFSVFFIFTGSVAVLLSWFNK